MDLLSQKIREAFDQYDREVTIGNFKVACILGMVLVPSFTLLDFFKYSGLSYEFLLVRLGCSGLIAIFLNVLLSNFGKRHYHFFAVTLVLLPGSAICYMIWRTPEGQDSPYYAGLNLVLLMTGFVLRWTLVDSLIASGLVTFEYLLACRLHGPLRLDGDNGMFVNNLFFFFATTIIVATGNYFYGNVRYREFAYRFQLDQSRQELEHINNKLSDQNLALERANREIKETEMQLVQSEKMSSLGRFSAGLMHDILNPLNYSRTGLFVLRKKLRHLPPEQQAEAEAVIADIEDGLRRVDNIVSDLRTFTHPGGQPAGEVSLEEVFGISLRFVASELKDHRITLKLDLQPGQKIWVSRNHFVLVLVNLLENAIDAIEDKQFPAGEEPRIEISSQADGERCRLVFRDNGPGIPAQNLPKIFDPFFTTKEIGKGTGLGLSICFGIVRGGGGIISARSEPGQFCEFTLDLPATAEAAERSKPDHAE
jgi:two-component system sensor histidine kinase PhcS